MEEWMFGIMVNVSEIKFTWRLKGPYCKGSIHCRTWHLSSGPIQSRPLSFQKKKKKLKKNSEEPFCLYISARHSAPLPSNFLAQSVKASFPLHHTDCCVDFDWLHQSLSGLFWSWWLWPPSTSTPPPLLLPRLLWQELLWMEEWPLWEWVSPRGQLGDIIRQDSYRRTHAFHQSCCVFAEIEAFLQEFSKFTFGQQRRFFPQKMCGIFHCMLSL